MKRSLKFLSMALLAFSMVVISACSDDEGGGKTKVIPPDPIKSITLDNGEDVEKWEYTYDEEGRVSEIAMTYNDASDGTREYDYSVAGKLTITRNGGSPAVYDLDSEDRVIKAPGDEFVDWYEYEYTDGILTKIYEHYDDENHLKWEMTVVNGNVTHRIQYEDDGVTVREDREFNYTIGDNASQIHQIYSVDSEWKWVGGVYGKQSKKLANEFIRHITADPTTTYGAEFDYEFDLETNNVTKVTKTGTSSGGSYTEIFTYTYYTAE